MPPVCARLNVRGRPLASRPFAHGLRANGPVLRGRRASSQGRSVWYAARIVSAAASSSASEGAYVTPLSTSSAPALVALAASAVRAGGFVTAREATPRAAGAFARCIVCLPVRRALL